jgi:Poly(3-hydroxybutyrate) depolymerase
MKKLYVSFILTFIVTALSAQMTTENITWGGQQREYLKYVPQSCNNGEASSVLFCLHELGATALECYETLNANQFAEEMGWIMIFPQALEGSALGYNVGSFWNVGITATVYGMPISINADVDDSGLMLAILDELETAYNVQSDSVFFAGFSLGGFMCQRIAIEHGDRINAIASVSGTIGNDFASATPVDNVNVLHIHGTADDVVSYDNAEFTYPQIGTFSAGLGAEATVEFWRSFNHCLDEAVVENYPDIQNDGLTFELHTFLNGDADSRVALMKVNGGQHAWYTQETNDVDYAQEIFKFFTNTMDPTGINANYANNAVKVYPNPARGLVNINIDGESTLWVKVFDVFGREVLNQCISTSVLDLSSLPNGIYGLRLVGKQSYSAKIMVSK